MEQRPATADEQRVLAAWSSWGAVPAIFDASQPEWAAERAELRELLSEREWAAASRTTINAHYTDPRIVTAMWDTLGRLGLTEGQALEPGAGSGTFIGLAPEGVAMTGVELDPTTARIAQALYPQATIRAESFADTHYPAGSFDAAIGNVPFGNVSLHDPRHNANGHSLHNHFIIKSLDMVRPGGVVAVLSSAFTLDAVNPGARREMYEKADLIGAVRLPSGAHRRTAGTEALTDLLVFRRRVEGAESSGDGWLRTAPVKIDGQVRWISSYFAEHPERVLGRFTVGPGMYGQDTLMVRADDLAAVSGQLAETLETIAAEAVAAGQVVTERPVGLGAGGIAIAPETGAWLGMVTAHPVEGFEVLEVSGPTPIEVPRSQQPELRSLLSMRDMARELLQYEATSLDDTPVMDDLRARLRQSYEAYREQYGPINRYTVTETKRLDPETGEPKIQRRKPPVMKWLRTDPFASLTRALERFDETSQSASPAALLLERVVVPRTPVLGVDTPDEAVAVALDTDGEVTLGRVAELLGVDEGTARAQLGERVYDDPETDQLVTRAEYLSGNVRVKLDAAEVAAVDRPELAVNVAALRGVMPTPLGADEITPKIGAVWVDQSDYQQFLREVTKDRHAVIEHGGGTVWAVKANRWSLEATSEWGTERRPAGELMESLLQQSSISVYDKLDDGSRVLNPTETEAAREKAGALEERFADWVWEDPERAARLTDEYNRRFNSIVLRDYSAEGERLTLPGMAATFSPRPHQRAAVARMLSEPAVGLFHQVGAGKTAEMVIGAMELKRLGMANKPVVVVPNHMLEQFSREWLQIYPQANVLAASTDDLSKENRRDFVARVATGDWDGVVMTKSAFSRLEISRDSKVEYQERSVAARREGLERLKDSGASLTVKRIERALLADEESLKQLMDLPRDPGLSFEDTGIDYLIIDEAHAYKNLRTDSKIGDATITGSKQATDLHMKAELLRDRHGDRVLTLATATPIANSITEAHVMSRYLRPDLLRDAGVEEFDQWAATFGQTVTEMEMAPTGGGRYREKTRFASFQNVPEMLRMWHTFADVKTAEDLNLPTPALRERADGQRLPETVIVPPTEELLEYVEQLGARAEALGGRAEKGADNMLTITTDGRRAALDMRLVGGGEPSGPTKLTVAADRIAGIWRANRDREYLDVTGEPSATRGGLQIVFCDQSTPKPDRWNAYSELKSQLIERGMSPRSVRFIHDAGNDQEKARLFAACRSGEVSVLIGSTEKMGVGTNVQARAVALHHIDCPWRPADLEQRDGRILRQGNQNAEVDVIRYTTGRSFDAYSWQTVERKQKFISQVLRGKLDVREIEDIGDSALSLGETKALAADDPVILKKATADNQLAKLERLSRAHQRNTSMLSYRAGEASKIILRANQDEPAITAAIAASRDTSGDAFRAVIEGRGYSDRTDAARALRDALMTAPRGRYNEPLPIEVELGGHQFRFERILSEPHKPEFHAYIEGVPRTAFLITGERLSEGIGTVRTLENRVTGLPTTLDKLRSERATATTDETAARQAMTAPFKYSDELRTVRADVQRINAVLAERSKPADAPTPSPADDEAHEPVRPAAGPDDDEAREAARIAGLGQRPASAATAPRSTEQPRSMPLGMRPPAQAPRRTQ